MVTKLNIIRSKTMFTAKQLAILTNSPRNVKVVLITKRDNIRKITVDIKVKHKNAAKKIAKALTTPIKNLSKPLINLYPVCSGSLIMTLVVPL